MKKRKILFIISNLYGGGAEKVLVDILERLDRTKFDIDVFLISKEGVYVEKVESILRKKILHLYGGRKDLFKNIIYRKAKSLFLIYFYRYCKNNPNIIPSLFFKKYDVEIAFLEGAPTQLLSRRVNKAKKIAWVHIDMEKHRMLNFDVEKECYRKMSNIICVSKDSKNSLLNLYPELNEKTEVIYNPIDREEINRKASEEEINFDKESINLIAVGRLAHQKGFDILLKAFKELNLKYEKLNLYILGAGGDYKKLKKYVDENGLEKKVKFLGFQKNPYPYIKAADIFISSSRYEGYPLVLCEAISLGKPIIATKCTGPIEILENGKYGLLAEIENVSDLKNKIEILVSNTDKRIEYSNLSKECSKKFKVDEVMKQIENLLEN